MKIIDLLDAERREIQQRIHIRAALHRAAAEGISISPIGTVKVMDIYTAKHRPMTQADLDSIKGTGFDGVSGLTILDAYRYVEIEDQQWKALGMRDTGFHEQPPI
jgi:hypothetical protein